LYGGTDSPFSDTYISSTKEAEQVAAELRSHYFSSSLDDITHRSSMTAME